MKPPNGIAEIKATFGDIAQYIHSDGTLALDWETENIGMAHLPFPLPLSWAPTVSVTKMRCHKLLVPVFETVFGNILAQGLVPKVHSFGGCYQYRPERGSAKLSTHSWGIAVDINPDTNPLGATAGDMDAGIIAVFNAAGFLWGGNYTGRKDWMHFQFATGY
jgi:D-alanyl-D-alanine carboxypeptidase